MSLKADDNRARNRSKSPSGRRRERSASREPAVRYVAESSAPYPDDEDDQLYQPQGRGYDSQHVTPAGRNSVSWSAVDDAALRGPRQTLVDAGPGETDDDKFSFLPQKYGRTGPSGGGRSRKDSHGGGALNQTPDTPLASYSYGRPAAREYERLDGGTSYSPARQQLRSARSPSPSGPRPDERDAYAGRDRPRGAPANVVTVEPGYASGPRPQRSTSPLPPTTLRPSLSLSVGRPLSAGAAPPSPLLESYHGTYQSMSPMPSPLLLASAGPGMEPRDAHVLDVSPACSDDERPGGAGGGLASERRRRRARFADPADDAERLATALRGSGPPDPEPLIEILPGMTHEQIMTLRREYKRLVKTGPDRKGVNIAKHIRSRLKDEDPALMKACYTVSLGMWESEAYWANFWYHGDKTRRELLIESLMGRTNDEIHAIKAGFSDRKYDNSLRTCLRTELKEDKFKKAVMAVLDEKRMEETDRHGRALPTDWAMVKDDVRALYQAVRAEKGGESAMIGIVVIRSDSHLREVLRLYNSEYRSNFARDALKKSGNLVGELLAHILNGVINKPVRDALLLHHALASSPRDELRRELLTSRLVRFHWDRHHLAAVKVAYRDRYGRDLQEAVKDVAGNSDWGRFCRELCITRMPGDVRKVDRLADRAERW